MSKEIQYDKDGNKIVDWFKSNGVSIPIVEGQSKEEAVEEHRKKNENELYTTDESGAKYFKQNASYDEILAITQRKNKYFIQKNMLETREWARYYYILGEIKAGAYVDRLSNGDLIIKLHKMSDKDKPKILISTPNYIKPRVKLVLKFKDEENMLEACERLKEWHLPKKK